MMNLENFKKFEVNFLLSLPLWYIEIANTLQTNYLSIKVQTPDEIVQQNIEPKVVSRRVL